MRVTSMAEDRPLFDGSWGVDMFGNPFSNEIRTLCTAGGHSVL